MPIWMRRRIMDISFTLDLLGVLGEALLPLLHDAEQRLHRQVHLFDPLNQGVLVEGHGLGTLVQVVLVPQAELQHLHRV
uniref:Uncharacterized protein n=1 Tax=Anguilla anguilla TaxID=7936 RepID=A0A0E9Q4H9_ANGAN